MGDDRLSSEVRFAATVSLSPSGLEFLAVHIVPVDRSSEIATKPIRGYETIFRDMDRRSRTTPRRFRDSV